MHLNIRYINSARGTSRTQSPLEVHRMPDESYWGNSGLCCCACTVVVTEQLAMRKITSSYKNMIKKSSFQTEVPLFFNSVECIYIRFSKVNRYPLELHWSKMIRYKRFKRAFIYYDTDDMMLIFREIPFFRPQHDTYNKKWYCHANILPASTEHNNNKR